ncbi:hypothetical protein [Nocardioides sp. SYSU DS0651]|uniref:hypothetical protein n=1 Tax=Nocardioides sp. SYSU DS0651 TaxID=3415955 RepID=UPI003F4B449C
MSSDAAATTVVGRAARAEWSRIWSVRSSWALLLAVATVVLGLSTVLGLDARDLPVGERPDKGAWVGGQVTGMLAMFLILALAAVTAAADHGTGGIVPTLQWTPRRGALLAARAGVVVVTTTLLGLLLVVLGCVLISLLAPSLGLPAETGLRVVGRLGFVYLTGTALAVGLGLLLRSTAGALVGVIALMLVLPLVIAQFPYEWAQLIADLLPGRGAVTLIFEEDVMTLAEARATLAGWAVAGLAAGGWRVLRTDADR